MSKANRHTRIDVNADYPESANPHSRKNSLIQPLVFFLSVGLLIVLVSVVWPKWYSTKVSLQRYCDNPQQTLIHLERILKSERPAGNKKRLPYLIAAKLLYLEPQQAGETQQSYLLRLKSLLIDNCQG